MRFTKATVEDTTLAWFAELALHLAPDETGAERNSFADILLIGRLRDAITRQNRNSRKRTRRSTP